MDFSGWMLSSTATREGFIKEKSLTKFVAPLPRFHSINMKVKGHEECGKRIQTLLEDELCRDKNGRARMRGYRKTRPWKVTLQSGGNRERKALRAHVAHLRVECQCRAAKTRGTGSCSWFNNAFPKRRGRRDGVHCRCGASASR